MSAPPSICAKAILHVVSQKGMLQSLSYLLQNDAVDVNSVTETGYSALSIAVIHGHTDLVQLLLKHPDIKVNLQEKENGNTALHFAHRYKHFEIEKILLDRKDIDTTLINFQGQLAKDISLFFLFDAGSKSSLTPLMKACVEGSCNLNVLLEDSKQNIESINKQSSQGNTVLHIASAQGHTACVEQLLAINTTLINTKNNDGNTPLHLACVCGQIEVAKALLAHPTIDREATNNDGLTPLHMAV